MNPLEKELTCKRPWGTLGQLRDGLNAYVWRLDNVRLHSTLGRMTPVEFREAGLTLEKVSK